MFELQVALEHLPRRFTDHELVQVLEVGQAFEKENALDEPVGMFHLVDRFGALVSFLAVYREMFETVLFYETLWAQVGEGARHAMFGGIGAAIVLLVAAAWAVFKYSIRLPIRLFFSVTAVLLALLAVIFTGQGIAALQEAGRIPVNALSFVSVPALGIFPTWQSLGAQLVVLLIVLASFQLAGRSARIATAGSA